MSAPENSNPQKENRPAVRPVSSWGQTTILHKSAVTASPESTVSIPTPKPTPPPLPPVEGATEIRSESAKPQLRAPEVRIASPTVPSAGRPTAKLAPRSAAAIWAVRAGLFAGVAFSLGLLYWSVFMRLTPVTSMNRSKAIELNRAADELEALRRRWSPEQMEEIQARHAQARASLFKGPELTSWEEQTRKDAMVGDFDIDVRFSDPQSVTGAVSGIIISTAQVNVHAAPSASTNAPAVSSYGRLLKLTAALGETAKRLDLIELSVTGDSNSVSQAQASVQLYAEEPIQ